MRQPERLGRRSALHGLLLCLALLGAGAPAAPLAMPVRVAFCRWQN